MKQVLASHAVCACRTGIGTAQHIDTHQHTHVHTRDKHTHRHILIQASRAEANDDKAPPGPAGSMTIAVHAVGAAVYLIDAHAAAAAAAAASGGTQDMPGVVEATPGTSVPTTPLGSTGGAAGAETGSATGQGGPGDASAVGAAAEAGEAAEASGRVTDDTQSGLLRMLALYLDCGVDMEMQVG